MTLALFACLWAPPSWASFPPVLFVDRSAAGPVHDGSSWCSAYTDLQDALAAAQGDPVVREIRIADGTYTPDRGTGDRAETFRLVNGVSVRGGYAGCGEPDSATRDIAAYETILSGDLLGNDGEEFQNYEDNSLHIVTALNLTKSTLLEGLTIRGGNADGPDGGAAIWSRSSHVGLRSCTIRDNTSGPGSAARGGSGATALWSARGGAVRAQALSTGEGSTTILDSRFLHNRSPDSVFGAGLSNTGVPVRIERTAFIDHIGGAAAGVFETGATILDCAWLGNRSIGLLVEYGGDVDIYSTVFSNNVREGLMCLSCQNIGLDSCWFEHNKSTAAYIETYGLASITESSFLYNSRTALRVERSELATVEYCLFSYNGSTDHHFDAGAVEWGFGGPGHIRQCEFNYNYSSDRGGAIHVDYISGPVIEECLFLGNHAAYGGALASGSDNLTVRGCTFLRNSADYDGGAIRLGWGSLNVENSRFVDNLASKGGALAVDGSQAIVRACEFADNRAMETGGALSSHQSAVSMHNIIARDNWAAGMGGAIYSEESTTVITHGTVVRNQAIAGAGMYVDRGLVLSHSILWENRLLRPTGPMSEVDQLSSGVDPAIDHCIVHGWTGLLGGSDNRGDDPQFMYLQSLPDWRPYGDNLHLRRSSPAINAGDPDFFPAEGEGDLDGHARVLCGRVDIGAYEWGIGDADCNGTINGDDAVALLACLSGPDGPMDDAACSAFDYFADGAVDLRDFASFEARAGGDAWSPSIGAP